MLRLALRMLGRDWRAGELRVLAAALVVAVASVTTVGFFADRVRVALARQANQLLGADLVVVSDRGVRDAFATEAARRGLLTARSLKFPSMVARGEQLLLSEVKAVSAGYPLRGALRVAPPRPGAPLPGRGEAFVDDKLAARLGLEAGAEVEVGAARFRVAGFVTDEPDQTVGFVSLGPRLLMNLDDLPATQLIQPGSRVMYRLLLAGEERAVAEFRRWAEPRLESGEKLEGVRDARPEIKSALERADRFLGLAALASVVLAAAALALAARRFSQRHLDACAMLRCLGASQGQILGLYLWHLSLLGAAASAVGVALGFAAHLGVGQLLADLVGRDLPLPTAAPALHGFLVGALLLMGFGLPPVANLRNVPTLRVLRRELGPPRLPGLAGYGAGALLLALLVIWQSADTELAAWVLGVFAVALALFALIAAAFFRAAGALRGRAGVTLRYGLAALRRRAAGGVIQALALGLGLMALLALTLVRADLLESWQASLPAGAPNRFLVNILPGQLEPLAAFFRERALPQPALFPMVKGRLIAINGRSVNSDGYADPRAKRLIEREFNLSWSDGALAPDNRVVAGRGWDAAARGQPWFSVEEGLAQTLGIRLGDALTYDVAGSRVTAEVVNLRKVDWDSFRVNFFVVAPPGLLESQPVSFITAFHLPGAQAPLMNELVRRFPNLLLFDVGAILDQVKATMDHLARAVQFVFGFTLAAGVVVLYAAIVASQDERQLEAAMFRTLGASRRQLIRAQAAEFLALGALAGLFAAAGATALAWVLSAFVLNLPFAFNAWIWPAGILGGALGVAAAGLAGTRGTLGRPPLQTLRRLA